MPRRTLALTPEQRQDLVATRDHDARAYLREMCAALLKVADGELAAHVARTGLHKPRDPDTVYRWLATYQAGGLAALVHRPRGHRGFSPSAGGRVGGDGAAGPGHPRV